MKIKQSQYFEIEEFFTERCRLVETEFIEEMTDHFVDSVEAKMAGAIPFEEALNLVIEDFGGYRGIRKMEWKFRRGFIKKQIRDWWALVKGQLARPKLYRTMAITAVVATLTMYLFLNTKGTIVGTDYLPGFVLGQGLLPLVIVPIFLLQRHLTWLRVFGVVRSQHIFRTCITFLLFTISILLHIAFSGSALPLLTKGLLCSALWSVVAVFLAGILEYSNKFEPGPWYQTR